MRRSILCSRCAARESRGVNPDAATKEQVWSLIAGEHAKHVRGELKFSCVCDLCGEGLPVGSVAVAESTFDDRCPYFEWEGGYLESGDGK